MTKNQEFIDYYEVLQISPNAELETIRRVYKLLAVRMHPDNPATGNAERFRLINEAYGVLSDPDRRSKYNTERVERANKPLPVFEMNEFAVGVDGEVNRRIGILCLLYNSRRTNEDKPGLSVMEMEKLMGFPREHLAFAIWYLKSKQLITMGESSDLIITSEGIDFLESNLPTSRIAYKLLKSAETGTMGQDTVDEPPVAPASQHRARNGVVQ